MPDRLSLVKEKRMKTILSMIVALILTFALTISVAAQDDAVTAQFRITVQGTPCLNATFFAVIGVPDSEFYGVQLADPDGDGVFTGSTQLAAGRPFAVFLVQGTGVIQPPTSVNPFPGPPISTIKDFGQVTPTEDMVFEASIAGCPAGLPDTGVKDSLPVVPIAGGILLLTGGIYLRRRVWQHA
jgi:LPXTG-motif cell wall-anchored protein